MRKNLAWLGVVVFAVSWFIQVHQMQEIRGAMGDLVRGLDEFGESLSEGLGGGARRRSGGDGPQIDYGGPPGWGAFRFAFDLLRDANPGGGESKGDDTKRMLLGATSLTNVVMLLAALMLFLSLRGIPRWVGFVLLLCAGLNLGWLYHTDAQFRDGLGLGYWLWTGSFVLVGLSSLMAGQD